MDHIEDTMKITKLNHIAYYPESLRKSLQELGDYVEYDDVPDGETAAGRLAETDIGIVEWSVNVDRQALKIARPRLKHLVVRPALKKGGPSLCVCYSFVDRK